MKCGVTDIGSNTIQLTVYHCEGAAFRPLLNRWETVGLAGYVENGRLSEAGVRAACRVLEDFQTLLKDLEVPDFYVFATASLRGLANTDSVLAAIRAKTGLGVELLSGEEEAECSFRGALLGNPVPKGLMTDIGGGSTELVAYDEGGIRSAASLPVGVVKLFNRFVEGVLPTAPERSAIRAFVAPLLDRADIRPSETLLVVGGSARAVGGLCNLRAGVEGYGRAIPAGEVHELSKFLAQGGKDALHLLLKAAPDRVHTVAPGLLLLEGILDRCGAGSLTVSATGVREGYLLTRVMGM